MADRFTGRTLSLFLAWELTALGFMVGQLSADPAVLGLFVFYFALILFLAVTVLYLAVLNRRVDAARDLFAVDVPTATLSLAVGALATFGALLVTVAWGRTFRDLPADLLLMQGFVVVPAEEFAFRFFLPRVLPGRLIGVPSWVWAQVTFAGFHWRAFDLDPFLLLISFLFGLTMYLFVHLGGRTRFLGLGFAIGVHFVWNVFAFGLAGAAYPGALL